MKQKHVVTAYSVHSPRISRRLRLAVAADLHSTPWEDVLEELLSADAVLLPGDLLDRHHRDNALAERFLADIPDRVPVFYALGNHERKYRRQDHLWSMIASSSVRLLDNESCLFEGIRIGGLSSVGHQGTPDTALLEEMERAEEYTLLMCHEPEMYFRAVSGRAIDLTLCGHAHGGQIQIAGHGLYAPGQGLFPKWTNGWYDGGRMLLSRGMSNHVRPPVPRIGNPCELILLDVRPD